MQTLPPDLLTCIAAKLENLNDVASFACTCKAASTAWDATSYRCWEDRRSYGLSDPTQAMSRALVAGRHDIVEAMLRSMIVNGIRDVLHHAAQLNCPQLVGLIFWDNVPRLHRSYIVHAYKYDAEKALSIAQRTWGMDSGVEQTIRTHFWACARSV
jgi:hypothetical protein